MHGSDGRGYYLIPKQSTEPGKPQRCFLVDSDTLKISFLQYTTYRIVRDILCTAVEDGDYSRKPTKGSTVFRLASVAHVFGVSFSPSFPSLHVREKLLVGSSFDFLTLKWVVGGGPSRSWIGVLWVGVLGLWRVNRVEVVTPSSKLCSKPLVYRFDIVTYI